MNVTFSHIGEPHILAKHIRDAVAKVTATGKHHKLEACIKRIRHEHVTFTLESGSWPASSDAHDDVIRALLAIDPGARVKTARAVYEDAADFEAQVAARGA